MSGERYLLDTNAIIQLLKGNLDVLRKVNAASYVCTSVICKMEYLAFPDMSEADRSLFGIFLSRIAVLGVGADDDELADEVASFRKDSSMKLPDAIIAATALLNNCVVLTKDDHFRKQDLVDVEEYDLI